MERLGAHEKTKIRLFGMMIKSFICILILEIHPDNEGSVLPYLDIITYIYTSLPIKLPLNHMQSLIISIYIIISDTHERGEGSFFHCIMSFILLLLSVTIIYIFFSKKKKVYFCSGSNNWY